jgi:hypothetical protein
MSADAGKKMARFFVRLRLPHCISVFVGQLRIIIAVWLLALWMPATSFCSMENAGWIPNNDGCCGSQSSEVAPCCALAAASYKMDEGTVTTAPAAQLVVALIDFPNLKLLPQPFARTCESGVSPPELSQSWQFSFRTALAPRAPSAS